MKRIVLHICVRAKHSLATASGVVATEKAANIGPYPRRCLLACISLLHIYLALQAGDDAPIFKDLGSAGIGAWV